MILKRLIFILLLILPTLSFSQEVLQDEMVEDFNQLISIINDFYRAKPLVENRTHLNISEQLNSLKKGCDTLQTNEEFTDLIRMTLNVLNDKHTVFANSNTVKMYISKLPTIADFGGVTLSDTLNVDYYFNLSNSIMSKMKTGIRSKYINQCRLVSKSS